MKKKLIFLLVITLLLLVPIKFNKVYAADSIPDDLRKYCESEAEKYVKTLPPSSEETKQIEAQKKYKECIAIEKERWESNSKPSDNIKSMIKKVCDELTATFTEHPLYSKEQINSTCMNYLIGSYKDHKCQTVDCLKKEICKEKLMENTYYCTGKKPDPKKEVDPDPDAGVGGGKDAGKGLGEGLGKKPTPGGSLGTTIDTPCAGMDAVVYYAVYVVKILHIVIPILLILWASIDLLRSVISGDEKKISAARKPVIQRFVSALIVFLLPWLVNLMVSSLTGQNEDKTDWSKCWRKAWNGGEKDDSIFNIRNW